MSEQTHQHSYSQNKDALLKRLNRIEGQVKGIQKMIEGDRYCIDVVQQLTAVSSAISEVSLAVLQSHIEGCVSNAIKADHSEHHIEELMAAIRKAIKR
ncbi:MAG: metal-sensitive transcriptional regulator [Chloroflexi bacterium]|jgi:CsoR family transcriptional regulator, copper-sensing transcriptional repressor|nr:metal-sensitive transcriptional regulator [Chloroflexota bacterium]MBT7080044.1 metal-sensitive transcriptional regulator [Chloroflexota bacterium]MBT7289882.1 metal-sensitive transcriptional regulator [Chloroflexota bacterium]